MFIGGFWAVKRESQLIVIRCFEWVVVLNLQALSQCWTQELYFRLSGCVCCGWAGESVVWFEVGFRLNLARIQ